MEGCPLAVGFGMMEMIALITRKPGGNKYSSSGKKLLPRSAVLVQRDSAFFHCDIGQAELIAVGFLLLTSFTWAA